MHGLFHFMFTADIAAPQSVLEWIRQVILSRIQIQATRRCLNTSKISCRSYFGGVGGSVWTGVIRGSATLRHILTTVLGVWFEQLVSIGHEGFHYIGHCLLSCPSFGIAPKLALMQPKEVSTSLLLPMNFKLQGHEGCLKNCKSGVLRQDDSLRQRSPGVGWLNHRIRRHFRNNVWRMWADWQNLRTHAYRWLPSHPPLPCRSAIAKLRWRNIETWRDEL